jgi:hypothetical protein
VNENEIEIEIEMRGQEEIVGVVERGLTAECTVPLAPIDAEVAGLPISQGGANECRGGRHSTMSETATR